MNKINLKQLVCCAIIIFFTQLHAMQRAVQCRNIHDCCFWGNLEQLKCYVEIEKHNINELDYCQLTPLMMAAQRNHLAPVQYLLEQKADPFIRSGYSEKKTAFYYAVLNGNIEMMQLLVDYGVDVQQENALNNLMLTVCSKHNRYDFDRSAYPNHAKTIKKLVQLNISLDCADENGLTPLHLLSQVAQDDSDVELLQLCLDHGISVDVPTSKKQTPLMLACCNNKKEAVSFLLRNNAAVHLKNSLEKTALFYGIKIEDHYEISRILLEHGANLNDQDNDGNTILHYLATFDTKLHPYLRALLPFLENPHNHVDINKQNHQGDTALHVAARAQRNYPEFALGVLLFYGADIRIKNNKGETPADCVDIPLCPSRTDALKTLLGKKCNEKICLRSYNLLDNFAQKSHEVSGDFERKQFLAYTLPPLQLRKEADIIMYNDEQESKPAGERKPLKRRTTITKRLRDREYSKRMPEQLYINYQ